MTGRPCLRALGAAAALCASIPCFGAGFASFSAGGRLGSDPAFSAASSLGGEAILGAYAGRVSASGEALLDVDRRAYFKGGLLADASRSFGSAVAGLSLDASGDTEAEESAASLSVPVSFNGERASFNIVPRFGYEYDEGDALTCGASASLSLSAGDFVLKPGIAVLRRSYSDGTDSLELTPSLGAVWYPGLPLSADFSAGWRRLDAGAGDVSAVYPFSCSVSAIPAPWLLLSVAVDGTASGSGLDEYRAEASAELSKAGKGGVRFLLPISAFADDSETDGFAWGIQIGAGISIDY